MQCFLIFTESYPSISGKSVGSAGEIGAQKRKLAASTLYSDDFTFLLGVRPEKS